MNAPLLNQRRHHEAWDELERELQHRAPLAVDAKIKAGADPLADDDEFFWNKVKSICGEEYVGRELPDIQAKARKIADLENARGRPQMRHGRVESHWAYSFNNHMAALQLDAAISKRIARAIQVQKYGRSYV